MTGPEHYCAAEALIEEVGKFRSDDFAEYALFQAGVALCLQQAQVHATLAQVALAFDTASPAAPAGINNDAAWYKAIQA